MNRLHRFLTKTVLLALPFCGAAATPAYYMPLEGGGSPEVIGADGKVLARGVVSGKGTYTQGVTGQALDVRRHAYDQVTTARFMNLPEFNPSAGTVSFWFRPHWKESDPEGHWLVYGDTWKNFRFYLIKQKSGVELSVCAPGQIQLFGKDLFRRNEWTNVTFTWDTATGSVHFYINGKEAAKRIDRTSFKAFPGKQTLNLWLGGMSEDRFKANVGDGLYDDIRIYREALSPDEVFLLASGGIKQKFEKVPADRLSSGDARVSFVLRTGRNRFPGPETLMKLSSGAKTKFTVSAMGPSGRLSLFAEAGGKPQALESAAILDLKRPHRITLVRLPDGVDFRIDGVSQGILPFRAEKSFLPVSAEAAPGVRFDAPDSIPSADEQARLTRVSESPLERTLWTLSDSERSDFGIRRGVTLNGYWRVSPVQDATYAPPEHWGYMRVPGSFRSPLWQIYRDSAGTLSPLNGQWNGKSLISYRSAWYQRVFDVPADLVKKGGRIYLNFKELNADYAKIFLNGKQIDSFRQDFKNFTAIPNERRIDVTDGLSKTGKNLLTLFVDRAYVNLWQGVPSIGDHGEIALGDVWLETAPSKISLSRAIAMPSFRRSSVSFRVRVKNPSGAKGGANVRVSFTGKTDGKTTVFDHPFRLSGAPEQVLVFEKTWRNPRLWSVETPENISTMNTSLSVDGKDADSLPPSLFGFREVWVENGEFRINGKKMRIRMYSSPGLNRMRYYFGDPDAAGQYVAHIREMNYDTVRFDPIMGKTSRVAWDAYLKECNLQGLYNLFPMPPYEDEDSAEYTAQVERFLEYYGNHPSILMWFTDMNTCGYPWDQDPAKLNDTAYRPSGKEHALRRVRTAEKVMSALDPSRELFQHAGGNSGKIFTSMNYQSFGTPLQEQEDWPAQWAAKHTQPLMVVETGFPYPSQFEHFDNPKVGFLTAEHAARYFGDAAFSNEIRPAPNAHFWSNNPYARWSRNYLLLSGMMYRNVVRAWRAYDLSALGDFPGERDMVRTARSFHDHNMVYKADDNVKSAGLNPDILTGNSETQSHILTDYSLPEALHDTIRGSFAPLLAYLGGDPADFTNKDHAFFSEEPFRKSVVVVNDHLDPRELECRWELVSGGTVLRKDRMTVRAEAGGIVKAPIELKAPEVFERTEGELRLTVLLNGRLLVRDTFALEFFPKHAAPVYRDVAAGVYDPVGKTTAMLKKASFPFRPVKTVDDLRFCRLLIIGQDALGKTHPEFLKQLESENLLGKGLKILIFEQQPCNLGNLVFESPSYRNAFIRRPDSPYLAGLKEADFANWRGASDTVPAYVLSNEKSPHYPRSKWKCGNGGIVSGNVIRKPTYGNFTTIVDSGFNLMFASLLELRKGHGLVLFCQLDVTSRYGKDPAATRLVDNMLSVMGRRFVPVGPVRAAYFGDDSGAKRLDRMGVEYTRINPAQLWRIMLSQVLILGPGPMTDAQKKQIHTLSGTRPIVFLPGVAPDLLPSGLKMETKSVYKARVPKNDPLFAGIPDADLYYREARDLPVVANLPEWAVATDPAIFAKIDSRSCVILGVAPEDVKGVWNNEKTARVWTAILNNMNIGLGRGLSLFGGSKYRHNTRSSNFGEASLTEASLMLDPSETRNPGGPGKFVPVVLGKTWEEQGFTKANPSYRYPANTPASLRVPYDGVGWYRCKVRIPAAWKGHTLRFEGGPIDDCDRTYLNGKRIGETNFENHPRPWLAQRSYRIPPELVKFGAENEIEIRVFDRWGGGGVTGPLKIVAEQAGTSDGWTPYLDGLDFYDVDAFHNW